MNDHMSMLTELLDDESDSMSAWEVEFIESLAQQVAQATARDHDWEPSPKQESVLTGIWRKVFA